MVKNPSANAADIRDVGLIPGSERFPRGRHGNTLQYSTWEIPWTEEPGGLPSMGSQTVRQDRSDIHSRLSFLGDCTESLFLRVCFLSFWRVGATL